jgi:hypothetical protein
MLRYTKAPGAYPLVTSDVIQVQPDQACVRRRPQSMAGRAHSGTSRGTSSGQKSSTSPSTRRLRDCPLSLTRLAHTTTKLGSEVVSCSIS